MANELSMDRLIGTLIERTESMGRELHAVSAKLNAISNHHENRVGMIETRITALEMRWAEKTGSNKTAMLVFGGAATIGGIVATFFGHILKVFGHG